MSSAGLGLASSRGRRQGTVALYTPELLALALDLARFPLDASHPRQGEARSRICGSIVGISLKLDETSRIGDVGLRVSACAVGQASAALFARSVVGQDAATITGTRSAIAHWLAGEGAMPWQPDLSVLAPAVPHKGRHAAILLPWDAAISALSKNSVSY